MNGDRVSQYEALEFTIPSIRVFHSVDGSNQADGALLDLEVAARVACSFLKQCLSSSDGHKAMVRALSDGPSSSSALAERAEQFVDVYLRRIEQTGVPMTFVATDSSTLPVDVIASITCVKNSSQQFILETLGFRDLILSVQAALAEALVEAAARAGIGDGTAGPEVLALLLDDRGV